MISQKEIDELDRAVIDALDMINANAIRKIKKRIALKRFREAIGDKRA